LTTLKIKSSQYKAVVEMFAGDMDKHPQWSILCS